MLRPPQVVEHGHCHYTLTGGGGAMWVWLVFSELQLSYDVISGSVLGDQFHYHFSIHFTATSATRQVLVTSIL